MLKIVEKIAQELNANTKQVEAAVALLDEGSTVPFIARYRKEATGGLDDTQLRNLEERLNYLRELNSRRESILKSIEEQEKLTPELTQKINAAETKSELEDLYLPYKPKRRTKAQIAREAGLEPLALALLQDATLDPEKAAVEYINPENGVEDSAAALEGAKQIIMEMMAENADLLADIRLYLTKNAYVKASVMKGKEQEGNKFKDYFEYSEPLNRIPSHRALALFRGRKEGVLSLELVADKNALEDPAATTQAQHLIAKHYQIKNQNRAADQWLETAVLWAWRVKIQNFFETELLGNLKEMAETQAIKVFAGNLKDLLMAAPAGQYVTMGLDPGLRTGVKVVVVDDTGKLLTFCTIFPHAPQKQWDASIAKLHSICQTHKVKLVSIGNGTASRETDKLVAELMKKHSDISLQKIMVNEAGASVYSASKLAAEEFPELDVSYRGAVSIARRLQDPLAELVKIEPKAIGVGQYQHDVSQSQLGKMLASVVEDCVNAVGVDLNTASVPLLTYISGLNKSLAQNIVHFREEKGRFSSREQLKQVERMGPKVFEQAAGFLRISDGENPLDKSGVHPETYNLVSKMLSNLKTDISQLMGNQKMIAELSAADYVEEKFGLPTINDIFSELEKPARDPRGEFKTANFMEGVEKVSDLVIGMKLEGSVTNVTDFGAFVDIGVHQDGLVHISVMSQNFISDPRQVVKTGDIVTVHVTEVDIERKRISLSMIGMDVEAKPSGVKQKTFKTPVNKNKAKKPFKPKVEQPKNSAFADALSAALSQNDK
ncbi:MAG: RNA-binding transcriptional accessory protein, partial [Gammaproteobacteria bacterium]|nr:RNA-binding transcriptional accessory protein [Gammaproteobacteria bacterium]